MFNKLARAVNSIKLISPKVKDIGINNRPLSTIPSTDIVNKVFWQQDIKDLDLKQLESYHNEKLIMVDEQDNVLGPISKGESHSLETIKKGVYHRALSLLIFDDQGRFLLTQRSSSKITFPDYYTNACCSHPLYNEHEMEEDGDAIGVKRATIRRSNFELGTSTDEISIGDLSFVNKLAYRAESEGGKWGEAEIDYIMILKRNIELNPNPDEVQSYRYVSQVEMKDLLLNHSQYNIKFTPWLKLMAQDFLFKYWSNLDDLDKIARPHVIINYKDFFPS